MLSKEFSHTDVLGLWKGSKYLSRAATDIGVPKHRVRRWMERGNVPPQYWPKLIEAVRTCFEIEITTDELTAAAVRAAREKDSADHDAEAA